MLAATLRTRGSTTARTLLTRRTRPQRSSTPSVHPRTRVNAPARLLSAEAAQTAVSARPAGFASLIPPPVPLILALTGAIPFVHFAGMLSPHDGRERWVAAHNAIIRALAEQFDTDLSPLKVYKPMDASRWMQTYACAILPFMAGVNWGAATRSMPKGAGTVVYLASLLPAIAAWAAVNSSQDVNPSRPDRDGDDAAREALPVPRVLQAIVSDDPASLLFPSPNSLLAAGFVWVLALDTGCAAAGLLPAWYVTYRILLTTLVAGSLKAADVGMEGGSLPDWTATSDGRRSGGGDSE